MSFVAYDIIFLILFTLAAVLFLYNRRDNLKREGLLYLYRTKLGLKIIEDISRKYERILRPLQYLILACGYVLMTVMIIMLVKFTYVYTKSTLLVQATKIPPLIPLIPYLPALFKVDWLPPLYFTYWIVVIAIIAVSHEFAHGIIARLNGIKIKSTGFGFLGPFLAAFVEPDEKQMASKSKFVQLSVLAAGTFANILMTILFGILMWIFFSGTFAPAGIYFNTYSGVVVNASELRGANGEMIDLSQISSMNASLINVSFEGSRYLVSSQNLANALSKDLQYISVYEDAPAIRAGLQGPIVAVDGMNIKSVEELRQAVLPHSPGDRIILTVIKDNSRVEQEIILGDKEGKPYLGIGIIRPEQKGLGGVYYRFISSIKDPLIYYEPVYGGDFSWFIYNLLWWIVLINISVALVNMLPVGIFDGGRFFYLTIWGITGKEIAGRVAFKTATWVILAAALWLMIRWAIAFI